MQWSEISKRNCSISRALGVVGERWTLLIVREAFGGARRFDDFRRRLGIARNVLSARLNALVADGVLERVPAGDSGGRAEYRLTAKGRDLYPVLVALLGWGDRWLSDAAGPPLVLVHRACGCETTGAVRCSGCGGELRAEDVRAKLPAGVFAAAPR